MKGRWWFFCVILLVAGCATHPTGENPFASIAVLQVTKIQVGDAVLSEDGGKEVFTQYFEITDPKVVQRLTTLAVDTKHDVDDWPWIGILGGHSLQAVFP